MVQSRKHFFIISTIFILIVSICLAAIVLNAGTLTSHKNIEYSPTPTPTATTTPTASPAPTSSPSTADTSTPKPVNEPASTSTPTATPTPTAKPTETPIPTPNPMPTPDPTLVVFSDKFQSGNMSAWTSTDTSGVNLSVKNGMLQCQTQTQTNGSWGYLYKWLDQNYTSVNWRWYIYFGDLPIKDGNVIGAGGVYNSAVENNFSPIYSTCSLAAVCENGAYHWQLRFTNASKFYGSTSTQTIQANTWYLVELKAVQGAGNGEAHLYLDNAEILNVTGLTNNDNAGIDHVSIGGGITADQPITWYCGGAVAAQTYVGPEPSTSPAATAAFPMFTGLATTIVAGMSLLSIPALFTIYRTKKLSLERKK